MFCLRQEAFLAKLFRAEYTGSVTASEGSEQSQEEAIQPKKRAAQPAKPTIINNVSASESEVEENGKDEEPEDEEMGDAEEEEVE